MTVKSRLPALIGEKQRTENRLINVAAISQATGVSRQTIYNWTNPDYNLERFEAKTIEAFCEYFGCDVGDLLTVVPPRQ